MNSPLDKIKHLLHLHACEQEGLSSGQPKFEEWVKAVNEANEAVQFLESTPPHPHPDIVSLEEERLEWSLKTFPEATPHSSLLKLKGEIQEVIADIQAGKKEPEEYADCLMCLFDSAGRLGITPQDIFTAFAAKLKKNKARTWVKNEDNTYSHEKT